MNTLDELFDEQDIIAIRKGPGANCSSIGSAVEMLFLSATVGAALLAAIASIVKDQQDEPDDTDPKSSEPEPPTSPPST